jgi:(2Fe-2S) ferredoxin
LASGLILFYLRQVALADIIEHWGGIVSVNDARKIMNKHLEKGKERKVQNGKVKFDSLLISLSPKTLVAIFHFKDRKGFASFGRKAVGLKTSGQRPYF